MLFLSSLKTRAKYEPGIRNVEMRRHECLQCQGVLQEEGLHTVLGFMGILQEYLIATSHTTQVCQLQGPISLRFRLSSLSLISIRKVKHRVSFLLSYMICGSYIVAILSLVLVRKKKIDLLCSHIGIVQVVINHLLFYRYIQCFTVVFYGIAF